MILKTRMLGQTYEFKDVKDVLAKASEKKSGDELAGVGAESALERIAAKEVLAQLTVADLTEHPVVPYEEDAVTRIIQDDIDETVYGTIRDRTIQEMREWILCDATDSGALMRASRGMTSEVIADLQDHEQYGSDSCRKQDPGDGDLQYHDRNGKRARVETAAQSSGG